MSHRLSKEERGHTNARVSVGTPTSSCQGAACGVNGVPGELMFRESVWAEGRRTSLERLEGGGGHRGRARGERSAQGRSGRQQLQVELRMLTCQHVRVRHLSARPVARGTSPAHVPHLDAWLLLAGSSSGGRRFPCSRGCEIFPRLQHHSLRPAIGACAYPKRASTSLCPSDAHALSLAM